MNDEYVQTLVMDINAATSGRPSSATEVADKIQASIDDRNEPSSEETFTQTYSYLT